MPQNADLGSLVAGGQATPVEDMGAVSPRTFATGQPEMAHRPPASEEERKAREVGWRQYLSDPRVKAGLIQMGVNFLSGMPAGAAIGGGFAAAGRADQLSADEEAAAAAQALRERQVDLTERQVANQERRTDISEESLNLRRQIAAGRGGGGKKAEPEGVLGFQGWLDLLKEQNEAAFEDALPPAALVDKARYFAAAESAGAPLSSFASIYDRNPNLAWGILQDYVSNPDAFKGPAGGGGAGEEGGGGDTAVPAAAGEATPTEPSVTPPSGAALAGGSAPPTLNNIISDLTGETNAQSIKNVLGRALQNGWQPNESELQTLEGLGGEVAKQVKKLRENLG